MKKLKVKLPGGGTLDVDEYESDIQDEESAADYNRRLLEEEAYDRKLDTYAEEIADRMETAERGERALEYWLVGKLILDHERELRAKEEVSGLREYERKGRSRERLLDKVAAIRASRNVSKERYSPAYLWKFIRHAKLMTESQAARPVPYSLQHELLYDWISDTERDQLLDRCEQGEFQTKRDLRRVVAELKERKRAMQEAPLADPSTADRSGPD